VRCDSRVSIFLRTCCPRSGYTLNRVRDSNWSCGSEVMDSRGTCNDRVAMGLQGDQSGHHPKHLLKICTALSIEAHFPRLTTPMTWAASKPANQAAIPSPLNQTTHPPHPPFHNSTFTISAGGTKTQRAYSRRPGVSIPPSSPHHRPLLLVSFITITHSSHARSSRWLRLYDATVGSGDGTGCSS